MTTPTEQEAEASVELKELVLYCARLAAQLKTSYRLGELTGFFEKLRNEKKIQVWGTKLERCSILLVEQNPHLWESFNHDEEKTIYNLWQMFGFNISDDSETSFPYELSALCLSNWIDKLYLGYEISPEELLGRTNQIIQRRGELRKSLADPKVFITYMDPFDSMVEDLSDELPTYALLFSPSA